MGWRGVYPIEEYWKSDVPVFVLSPPAEIDANYRGAGSMMETTGCNMTFNISKDQWYTGQLLYLFQDTSDGNSGSDQRARNY